MLKDNLSELGLTVDTVDSLNRDELWMLGKVCLKVLDAVDADRLPAEDKRLAVDGLGLVLHAIEANGYNK